MKNSFLRRYIIFLVFICLIFSCGTNENTENKNAKEVVSDTIVPFHGFWASEKYINTLMKTKSPRQSQDDGEFWVIPKLYLDRAYPCVYHEGGPDYHVIKNGNSYFLRSSYDSIQIVFIDDGRKIKIGDWLYIKTKENVGVPEDLLFKGSYKFIDKSVVFNADGTVKGLDSINFFSVQNDYIGPGMGDVDIVYLGKTKEEDLTHCFQFQADTLFIYNIQCLEEDDRGTCLDIQKGDLKYKLVKDN